jgi:uncharacterized protein
MQDSTPAADARPRYLQLEISGMHCANCVVAVERALKDAPGVQSVRASYPPGRAVIGYKDEIDLRGVHDALEAQGYRAKAVNEVDDPSPPKADRNHLEIAAAFLILIGVAFTLQHFQLLPRGFSVSDQMTYGLALLIGLVASLSSCLAVTGGLLVALAAKYNEANPYLSDQQRVLPHLYFNVGRILSYTLLGGAIGALGGALTLSPSASGAITLIASLVMIMLGLNMLGFLPNIGRYLPTLPPSLAHRLHDATTAETKGVAFLLGAATFFLPCGFTQALQLYVLSKGSFTVGALTMLAFALGTLPALLSLSAVSSLAKGAFQKHFLRFAGATIILLGIFNIRYGLVLTGSEVARPPTANSGAVAAEVQPDRSFQRIAMKVVDLEYNPHQFTVKQGIPVQWWIDGSQAEGCGRVLLAPGLGIRKILSDASATLINFTPQKTGDYAFNCGMGMMTPDSKITVLPN